MSNSPERTPIDIGPYRARRFLLDLTDLMLLHAQAGVGLMKDLLPYQREFEIEQLYKFRELIKNKEVEIKTPLKTPQSNEFKVLIPRKGEGPSILSVGINLVNNGFESQDTEGGTSLFESFMGIVVTVSEQEINSDEDYSSR